MVQKLHFLREKKGHTVEIEAFAHMQKRDCQRDWVTNAFLKPGVGNLRPAGRVRPASNSYAASQAPIGKKINMDEYYVYLARVVCAARDKNHNSFSARSGKKVAHHCLKQTIKTNHIKQSCFVSLSR